MGKTNYLEFVSFFEFRASDLPRAVTLLGYTILAFVLTIIALTVARIARIGAVGAAGIRHDIETHIETERIGLGIVTNFGREAPSKTVIIGRPFHQMAVFG
jgi:hypothetical protein